MPLASTNLVGAVWCVCVVMSALLKKSSVSTAWWGALHTDVALARRLAAVDGDDLARHERSLVGGEKDDRTGHFVGLADTAERDSRCQRGFVCRRTGEAVEHTGVRWAGSDSIDADAGRRAFKRRRLGHAFHRVLAAGIHRRECCSFVTVGR